MTGALETGAEGVHGNVCFELCELWRLGAYHCGYMMVYHITLQDDSRPASHEGVQNPVLDET